MSNLWSEFGAKEDTLSPEEKTFLAQNGYLNLGKLLSDEELAAINQRLLELLNEWYG